MSTCDIGIPAHLAAVILGITDVDLEANFQTIAAAGLQTLLTYRYACPEQDKPFCLWLYAHYPLRAKHVEQLMAKMHGGQLYAVTLSTRMTGTGMLVALAAQVV